MPPNTVYVGRPTVWGNMFSQWTVEKEWRELDKHGVRYSSAKGWRVRCVEMYRVELLTRQMADPIAFEKWLEPLRGKDLACWCKLEDECHADVLLEFLYDTQCP